MKPAIVGDTYCLNRLCWLATLVLVLGCWWALNAVFPLFSSLMGLLSGVVLVVYVLIWPVDLVERGLLWCLSLGFRSSLSSDLSSPAPRQLSRLIRGIAIVFVFIVFGGSILSLLLWALPILSHQIQQVIQSIPDYVAQLEAGLLNLLEAWGLIEWEPVRAFFLQNPQQAEHSVLVQSLLDWFTQQGNLAGGALSNSVKNILELVGGTLQRAFYVWLAIPFVFFFLMDGGRLRWVAKRFFSEHSEEAQGDISLGDASFGGLEKDVDFVLRRSHDVMMAFLRGQVLLGFITGVYMFFVYQWFDVKFALLLAVLFFVAEILPVIGTWLGIIPGLFVAYMSGGLSVAFWVWVCSYAYQTVKDNIVAPKVVGDVMGLHPLAVLVSILVFTRLFGLIGTVFAIPVTALCYAMWLYWVERDNVNYLKLTTAEPSPANRALVCDASLQGQDQSKEGGV